jgi:hypothetical protein
MTIPIHTTTSPIVPLVVMLRGHVLPLSYVISLVDVTLLKDLKCCTSVALQDIVVTLALCILLLQSYLYCLFLLLYLLK